MKLSRRDVSKLGRLAAVGAAGLAIPLGKTVSGASAGQRIEMLNLSNPNNRDFDNTNKIMAFDVTEDAFDDNDLTALVISQALNADNEVMAQVPTRRSEDPQHPGGTQRPHQ